MSELVSPCRPKGASKGGFGNSTILNDLWAFNITNGAWGDLTPAVSPAARFAAAGGFDLADNVLVLFSGATNTGLLADTWQYAYGPASGPSGPLSPTVILGVVALVAVGAAVAIVLEISRRRRSRGPPERPPLEPGAGRSH